ncbi:RNA-binding domain-containing protein, partial [Saitoella complicata NRRL Y-17804]|uniref:RNA-binding domain-containing protein n=1 Tax=Saitoella complicata (strain BCRC 22490 / CBS 7301 / JCM 7358 / NBRC 10748 / NRRL Y-17804) TaxID=698492 RepID=UPI0008674C1C
MPTSRSPTRMSRSPSPRRRSRSRSRARSNNRSMSRSRSRSRSTRSYSTYSRSRSRTRSRTRSLSPPPRISTPKIIVERLTKNLTPAHLREIFTPYGKITHLDLPMNRKLNVNRGVAYITFSSVQEAERAVECMHEAEVDGGVVSVSKLESRLR